MGGVQGGDRQILSFGEQILKQIGGDNWAGETARGSAYRLSIAKKIETESEERPVSAATKQRKSLHRFIHQKEEMPRRGGVTRCSKVGIGEGKRR